ncbi:MAG: ligase-associated DNA damage response DEXH box helicase [Marinovum sp.]|nr:ligase-associated DNA damage response DEXH box helicase [Marinovum sp.]MDG1425123.1 ligase-associated DNA damage response DEXH box helicase [Paracoccaceae bacterium]MDG2230703.1 ligase-associated DNA damage response DEXH box helicase [Paracoccaceae bacterium]
MTNSADIVLKWISSKGWHLFPHQRDMLHSADLPAQLLIAPTGAGKTLAGFLPTLAELASHPHQGLHTIYVSPLKALTADIKRNLMTPIHDLNLDIKVEDRTGDTSSHIKRRQRADPPQILLTTPESLALLISYPEATKIFAGVQRVLVDEIHALAESKRGDQLVLALSRLNGICPTLRRVGLSATVDDPQAITELLSGSADGCPVCLADGGPAPDISMLKTDVPPPWSGAGGRYAVEPVLEQIKQHKTTLVFHNTRAQAEIFFHHLWLANNDHLPIAIHHGSLDRVQRQNVETAMTAGKLRAIVCTGSLDLGIDWGDVDLVIQIGAPKNVKRLVQRIGRANHRYNAPSKALIVPANRFEVVECVAALEAVIANDLDGEKRGSKPLDVLCQHIVLVACAGPFDADELYAEVYTAGSYSALSRADFDQCVDFCTTGGYALKRYDQWHRLMRQPDGLYRLRDLRSAPRIRMNAGTIQDSDTLKVRLQRRRGGKPLGEIEEAFAATLSPGDTFLIGGQVVRFENLRDMTVEVSRQANKKPKIAVFSGTKFATSTQLSARILSRFATKNWSGLPRHTVHWLEQQTRISTLPLPDRLLLETFPRQDLHHLCIYGFAGRNAQQTLGLLLSKQLEARGLAPLGFVATDYATLIWGLEPIKTPKSLFDPDDLEQGLGDWLAGNAVMKRSFRAVATISGLIERNLPGLQKSGRQATFSSDILYDTLLKYDPDHLMMQITKSEAMSGLVDFSRIRQMLDRIEGRIDHRALPHLSPFSAPLFLEAGRVPVEGQAVERLISEHTEALIKEAGLDF